MDHFHHGELPDTDVQRAREITGNCGEEGMGEYRKEI